MELSKPQARSSRLLGIDSNPITFQRRSDSNSRKGHLKHILPNTLTLTWLNVKHVWRLCPLSKLSCPAKIQIYAKNNSNNFFSPITSTT
jgi:hypothetical protein